ncbi:MAG: hypothetical protein ABSA11_01165 [Candidatus Bathyarchaeia archaeon]|jgi:hypothetical protein
MGIVWAEVKPETKPEVQAKLTKKQKAKIYKKLLNVEDPDAVDRKAVSSQLGIDARVLGGMLNVMRNFPSVHDELARWATLKTKYPPGWLELVQLLLPLLSLLSLLSLNLPLNPLEPPL